LKIFRHLAANFRGLLHKQEPFTCVNLITLYDKERYTVNRETPSITIGRIENNKIVIPDERVSRLHCRIDYSEGIGVQITDYSKNGTWITDSDLKSEIYLLNKSGWFQISQGYIFLGLPPASGLNMTRIQFFCF
jgi:pSer/pThr/pTyr-binding forkhead associated (FHA) protein